MKIFLHLITFISTAALCGWCIWFANRRRIAGKTSFRVILPVRIATSFFAPFFAFAYWYEWGTDLGLFFLFLSIISVPLTIYLWTLRITIDKEFISIQHAFRMKRIRLDQIASRKTRDWSGEYVIKDLNGSKIVFPQVVEGADQIFARCSPSRVE